MLVCIGSRAPHYRDLDFRSPQRDLDLVGTYREIENFVKEGRGKTIYPIDNGKKIIANEVRIYHNNYHKYNDYYKTTVEAEVAWKNSSARELIRLVENDKETIIRNGFLIPSIDVLYMLKMSHRYLRNSPHFLKTMQDIRKFRLMGAKIRNEHRDFFNKRKAKTYDYAHPNLNVSKEDFFKGDGVEYFYDHDSIHQAVKHLEQPAYLFFKKSDEEVFCDRDVFESQDLQVRLYAVLEEAYVLALERSQIPFREKMDPKQSFEIALIKICSSITSGWFREFAWEHWDQVYQLYDEDYAKKFFQKADAGLVALYRGLK